MPLGRKDFKVQSAGAYSYVANSSLVGQITMKHSGTTEMTTTKAYDNLNRLTSITSASGSSVLDSHGYGYNLANQRTSMTNADGSYWVYGYDSLGQVISAAKHWSDGTSVAGEQFGNAFDDIGNRINSQMGGNGNGVGLRNANYSVNNLNQYTNRTVPGAVDIVGSATNTASVTVNGILADRHGSYYRAELPVNNSGGAVWQSVTASGIVGGTSNTQATVTGSVFVPQNPETFTYDKDGNLATDSRFSYTWDAENRLVTVSNIANIATGGKFLLQFAYDYLGRRIQKIVYTNSSGTWVPSYTNKFIYDGWSVVAILDGGNNVLQSLVWGSDLSGSVKGAGGVGGLVSMNLYNNSNAGTYFYSYDGSGNSTALVNTANGIVATQYEYGPFGEPIRMTGAMANANSFRFSTKYEDDESGLLYYGHRFYSTVLCRWLNRDPAGRKGGLNLYGFVANSPITKWDYLGLDVNLPPGGNELQPWPYVCNTCSSPPLLGPSTKTFSAWRWHVWGKIWVPNTIQPTLPGGGPITQPIHIPGSGGHWTTIGGWVIVNATCKLPQNNSSVLNWTLSSFTVTDWPGISAEMEPGVSCIYSCGSKTFSAPGEGSMDVPPFEDGESQNDPPPAWGPDGGESTNSN